MGSGSPGSSTPIEVTPVLPEPLVDGLGVLQVPEALHEAVEEGEQLGPGGAFAEDDVLDARVHEEGDERALEGDGGEVLGAQAAAVDEKAVRGGREDEFPVLLEERVEGLEGGVEALGEFGAVLGGGSDAAGGDFEVVEEIEDFRREDLVPADRGP
jgi:hypothetical protein